MVTLKQFAFDTTREMLVSIGLLFSRITIGLTLAYYVRLNLRDTPGLADHAGVASAVTVIVICSVLVLLGIVARPASLLLVLCVLAFNRLLFHDDTIHPWVELFTLYTAFYTLIVVLGAGQYSLDALLFRKTQTP